MKDKRGKHEIVEGCTVRVEVSEWRGIKLYNSDFRGIVRDVSEERDTVKIQTLEGWRFARPNECVVIKPGKLTERIREMWSLYSGLFPARRTRRGRG